MNQFLKLKKQKGFTIIETSVVIFIFVALMGAVFGSILMLYRIHSYTWQQSVAIDEARRGIKVMVREIREATTGEDGSYPIEKAEDKEFIFYSDIDKDGEVERVRYFLGVVNSGEETKNCVTFAKGGTCNVDFSDFLQGALSSAKLKVSVEGDFARNQENVEIFIDENYLGKICGSQCSDCADDWEGTATFDISEQAVDGYISLLADSSWQVDPICDWQEPNHSMKVKFELSWEEEITENIHQFKKGVTNPTSFPPEYPLDQEEVSIITSYVRNSPPIFEYFYFDKDENELRKIEEYPARLSYTQLMKVYLVVNINPNRSPQNFELESCVQIRNLKKE